MSYQLSEGCVKLIWNAGVEDSDIFESDHTVQLLSVKKLASNGPSAADRFRVVMSDGIQYLQAMLATPLNTLVQDGSLVRGTIAKVTKLSCNYVQERKLIIILSLEPVGNAERIGKPVSVEGGGSLDQDQPPAGVGAPSSSNVSKPPPPKAVPPPPSTQQQTKAHSVYPIEGLSPYQSNWTIKARVMNKSDMKEFQSQRGPGKLFNVTLMDESGEIRATAFNQVAEELYEKLEEGKAYYISKAHVNLAKKKFSNVNNDYELGFHKGTEVEECFEKAEIPKVKYSFAQLSDVGELPKDAICDVAAVLQQVDDVANINTKQNRTIPKRDITIVDESKRSMRLTLWGKQAERFNAEVGCTLAFKGVKVGDFGGKTLSMVSSSSMEIDPDLPQCHALKGWYGEVGQNETFSSFSDGTTGGGGGGGGVAFNRAQMKSIDEVKQTQLGTSEHGDVFSTRATLMHIKSDKLSYEACPTPKCGRKVEQVDGAWKCHKCDKSFPEPEHRYLISMAVADYSGQAWFQGFNEVGNIIFGIPANDFVRLKEEDTDGFEEVFQSVDCMTYNFSCRAKQDTFNDRTRIRYGISQIKPIDYKEEALVLRDLLYSAWAQ